MSFTFDARGTLNVNVITFNGEIPFWGRCVARNRLAAVLVHLRVYCFFNNCILLLGGSEYASRLLLLLLQMKGAYCIVVIGVIVQRVCCRKQLVKKN